MSEPPLWCILLTIMFIRVVVLQEMQEIYGEIQPGVRSLSTATRQNQHKCEREVPAIFFQTQKNLPIRGNGSTIYYHQIEVCCVGFIRSPYDWQHCIADCSLVSPNNCRNGICRAPNQCVCFDEFVLNERGECVHTCPIACQNGRCYLNGTCECDPGYFLDPDTRKFCIPHCLQPCGTNQECKAPGKCVCKEGYKMAPGLGCQPVCLPNCGHGNCVRPNECECFAGYMKRPLRSVCEAECFITCENGFCESRYKCQCWDGYKYDVNTKTCLPDCGDFCQNGVCIAPGVCRCFENYELRGSVCEPKCLSGCGYYGKCFAPETCACGVARQLCTNGNCDANGRCLCRAGLTRFIEKCVDPKRLDSLVNSYEKRDYYNQRLLVEFHVLIGRLFQFFN